MGDRRTRRSRRQVPADAASAGVGLEKPLRPPGQAESGARILREAAFLVPEKERKKFEKAVAARAKALGPSGYTVTLTGPWPAYNFVSESA